MKVNSIVQLREFNITVQVPYHSGELRPHTLVWARQIDGPFYEISLENNQRGFVMHLAKMDNEGVTLLRSTMSFSIPEITKLRLAEKLNLSTINITDQILIEWIKNANI
jgi:hypothetical protein